MPTLRLIGHKISAGHITVAAMGAVATIMNLTRQTDMAAYNLWLPPNADKSTIPTPAQVTTTLGNVRSAEGFYTWQWVFDYMTHDMYSYWRTTFLPSGIQSANVTVLAYDDTDAVVYLQAVMGRPSVGAGLTVAPGGYTDVTFTFTQGVIIT